MYFHDNILKNELRMNLTMSSELIVMLTYDDFTVKNANEIFEACVDSKAKYWGVKIKAYH